MQMIGLLILAMSGQFHAQNVSSSVMSDANSSVILMPSLANNSFSDEANISELVIFDGSGCPFVDSVKINTTVWDINLYFSGFFAKVGQNSTCEVSVPVDLRGGCLVALVQSATISGQVGAQVITTFDGVESNWCKRQEIQDPANGSGFFYSGPVPAICGDEMRMNLSIALRARDIANNIGGTFNHLMVKFVNFCNKDICGNITCSSDGLKINPQWLYLLIPIIAVMSNQ